jgi:c-di-GMP-binding flagellar brake protein YcgR
MASIYPDHLGDLRGFAIDHPAAINALLDKLVATKPWVHLFDETSDRSCCGTLAISASGLSAGVQVRLDAPDGPLGLGQSFTLVGLLDGIKLQFVSTVRQCSSLTDGYSVWFEAPQKIYRLQRRDAFRVKPEAHDQVRCVLRLICPEGEFAEVYCDPVDLSANGVAVRWPEALSLPSVSLLEHCRLEFGKKITVPCCLKLRRIVNTVAFVQVGWSFEYLSSEAQRTLQMAVVAIEKAQRSNNRPEN